MKKLLRMTVLKLFCLFKGAICGALVSIAPVALIHYKHLPSYFHSLNWAILIFFSLSIIAGSLVCSLVPTLPGKKSSLVLIYLFCYTACAALCQKIGLTLLLVDPLGASNISTCGCLLTVIPGLLLIYLAAVRFVTTAIKESKNTTTTNKNIKQSFYLSWLLFIGGIPLIFGVWLPLLAIPGAWVMTGWLD